MGSKAKTEAGAVLGRGLVALRAMETKVCPVCGETATKRAGWEACSAKCRQKKFREGKKKGAETLS